jgi:hypothetical protein
MTPLHQLIIACAIPMISICTGWNVEWLWPLAILGGQK